MNPPYPTYGTPPPPYMFPYPPVPGQTMPQPPFPAQTMAQPSYPAQTMPQPSYPPQTMPQLPYPAQTMPQPSPYPMPQPFPVYMPGPIMVPVPIGPIPDPTQNSTFITNYIYHGNEPSAAPAVTDQVSVVECSGDFDWCPTTSTTANHLTGRAVVGGYEGWDGSPLWIIRTWHEGGLYPGKLSVRHCSATIAYEGKEISVQNIEVLCAKPENLRWIPATSGNVPPGAIPGGRTTSGEVLYIGRARYQLSVTPGVVIPSKSSCFISFAGSEVSHKIYDVLCRIS